ncbi:Pentatricopeptide repeat-containing protein At1g10910, chloroplastic, partial [Linum perenne]
SISSPCIIQERLSIHHLSRKKKSPASSSMEISAPFLAINHFPNSLSPLSIPSLSSAAARRCRTSLRITAAAAAATSSVEKPGRPPRTVGNVRVSNSRRRDSNSYLSRQAAIREVEKSSDLESSLQRFGGVLKVQDLNVILRNLGNQSRWSDLSLVLSWKLDELNLFDWMQKEGKVSVSSYSSYLKFMGKSLNPTKALEVYEGISDESTKSNVFVCNSVLSCLVRSGKFNTSIKLFHEMKHSGLTPDAITYSTLLAGCIKMRNSYPTALDLVQELKYKGLKMDSVMYGTLLAVCASNNRSEEAENYFNQMKDEGHSPNEFHYSSLMNAYSFGGDYKKAEGLVEEMKSSGLEPNKVFVVFIPQVNSMLVILTTLLKVYVRGGFFEKSRELLSQLESLGYAKDEMPYCLLMDGLAKTGHIDEARSIFEEFKEKSVRSDGYAYSIMISAFCRDGRFEDAKELATEFETKYQKYDVVILNSMLCAYCRTGEMDSVMQTMRKMDELTIVPDHNTFNILIKYFCKEKLYILAFQTMEDMYRKGHHPGEELCSSLIFYLGKTKAHYEAFSVYKMLKYSKRTMCKALHEKILHILLAGRLLKDAYVVVKDNADSISKPAIKKFANAFVKHGSINLINDVMKAVHTAGYKIDQELFEIAISRYIAEPEKKDLFINFLNWMPGQGYAVNSSTRNLILKNSHLFGRQLIAEILSKQRQLTKPVKS